MAHWHNDSHPISDAIAFMIKAHGSQLDLGGKPYWTHPVRVMWGLGFSDRITTDTRIAALMHDVVEDTSVTLHDLESRYLVKVRMTVALLTKAPGEPYENYVGQIATSNDEDAIRIKVADLVDNLDPRRQIPDPVNAERIHAKHNWALGVLAPMLKGFA